MGVVGRRKGDKERQGAPYNIPDAVERAHHSNKENYESERLGVDDKPAGNEKPDGEQDSQDSQPVLLAPPEGEEEADGQDEAGDFAGDDIKAAEGEQSADEGRAQVAGRQGDKVLAADHVGDAALAGVERDGLNAASGADGGEGMAEFMERDDQHLYT